MVMRRACPVGLGGPPPKDPNIIGLGSELVLVLLDDDDDMKLSLLLQLLLLLLRVAAVHDAREHGGWPILALP